MFIVQYHYVKSIFKVILKSSFFPNMKIKMLYLPVLCKDITQSTPLPSLLWLATGDLHSSFPKYASCPHNKPLAMGGTRAPKPGCVHS